VAGVLGGDGRRVDLGLVQLEARSHSGLASPCERFDHSFCGGATDPGCGDEQVCDIEPGEAVGFCRPG
jgi:hypothetical protein